MATYRELSNMVLDLLKANSADDGYYTLEHCIFLLDKSRANLLNNKYENKPLTPLESNYQTICLDVELKDNIEGLPCEGKILESKETIPDSLSITDPIVSGSSYFLSERMTYVSPERFRFVGHNKWLQDIIYFTEFNNKVYIKSVNPQYKYLKQIKYKSIFENPSKAAEMSCNKDNNTCDMLDTDFPLEEGLQQALIELTAKELATGIYKPADNNNDASDDLSNLHSFIARNAKSSLQKQIDGDD